MAYYDDLTKDNDKLKCTLCMDIIPGNKTYIEEHLNSDNHKDRILQRLLITNGMVIYHNDMHCLLCNEKNLQLSVGPHILSSCHQKHLEQIKVLVEADGSFIELPNDLNSNKVHCLICDDYFAFKMCDIEDHIKRNTHRRTRAIAVQPLNGIFSVNCSDGDLWCKICPTYFENYIECIFEHVDNNKKHKMELGKLLRLVEGQNINIEKYLIDPSEDKAMCEKCDTKVPCNLDNLERHIKGERHRK
ncbi:uncharacterized protein LOC131854011 [Achroia grisella]|uniref:uncharacterized protein LOC131854011 n=1 Tax=Achroia grisella TaxID=688607 RepID=UPI0027D23F28|nr:uncharacterized protein LOC131854011 [Achroia grisella]